MKQGGGKGKGGAYERHICKVLSLWITNGAREDVFWRSAMSGGRATVRNRPLRSGMVVEGRFKDGALQVEKIVVRQAGDICAVAPEGHALTDVFYIECKHVKKLGLDSFLIKGTGPLATFWKKACEEAHKHDKLPLIIARQNGWPDLVVSAHPESMLIRAPKRSIITDNFAIYYLDDVVKTKMTAAVRKWPHQ